MINKIYINNIFRFFFLIFFQVLILNNIQFNGYINPYLYIYFILLLPFETPKWLLLISAFFLGLGIDMFSGTMGINAAATVFMAFFRPIVIKLIASKKDYEQGIQPSISALGFKWFFSYSLILVLIHHFAFFYIEVFRFSEFLTTFYRVIFSTIFTLILIIFCQYLFFKSSK